MVWAGLLATTGNAVVQHQSLSHSALPDVSYDPTRELYKASNFEAFAADWAESKTGGANRRSTNRTYMAGSNK
jgi:ABC-type sulfate transport system substrate-binding protein